MSGNRIGGRGFGVNWIFVESVSGILTVLVVLAMGGVALLLVHIKTRFKRHPKMHRFKSLCDNCGYDLRGQTERCPECGKRLPDGGNERLAAATVRLTRLIRR